MHLFRLMMLAWNEHRAFQHAVAAFQNLSERDLKDIGITRGDIPRLAYEEAERRSAPEMRGPSVRGRLQVDPIR